MNTTDASTGHDDNEDTTLTLLPIPVLVFSLPLMGMMLVVSVGGNVMVLLSYTRDSLMVDAHSIYLLNLAVCDLLLSVLCMPLHMMSTLFSSAWPLGDGLCWAYSTLQLTVLNVSSLVLVLIALDGLWQAQVGVRSTVEEARRKACTYISACWLLAGVVHLPVTISTVTFTVTLDPPLPPLPDMVCRPRFLRNTGHVLFLLVWDFILPVLVLAIANLKLYFILKRTLSVTALDDGSPHAHQLGIGSVSGVDITFAQTDNLTFAGSGDYNESSATTDSRQTTENKQKPEGLEKQSSQEEKTEKISARQSHSDQGASNPKSPPSTSSFPAFSVRGKCFGDKQHSKRPGGHQELHRNGGNMGCLGRWELPTGEGPAAVTSTTRTDTPGRGLTRGSLQMERPRRLKRVAVILFTLVLLLAVCWLPYSLVLLMASVCSGCVHPVLYCLVVWLLYCKAAINPFLYAYNTFVFRGKFRRLLARVVPAKRLKRIATDRVSNERASILKTFN